MNVLVINGSPKGRASNTYRLTKAFTDGLKAANPTAEICEIDVNKLDIKGCKGCFACWNKTPGKCCIADDMQSVLEKLLWADVTVWSFPLYYFSVPSRLKALIDRQLPMSLPFMCDREDGAGNGSHPARYNMEGKRHVIISTCGFYTAEGNYDSVLSMFDHMCGKGNYTEILCGQGELFRVKELSARTDEYLEFVRTAGKEYAECGISDKTRKNLSQLLYPKDVFEKMADASWGVDQNGTEKEDETFVFTKQMAALYNKKSYKGKDILLDMYYTDCDKRYRIILGKDGSRVEKNPTGEYTTLIETPFDVWCKIARGELKGDEALMKHMYSVKGDFNLMLEWDKYFGNESEEDNTAVQKSNAAVVSPTNMNVMLIPWIAFWIAVPINSFWGSIAAIAACVLVPILFFKNRKTIYDVISSAVAAGFSLAVLSGADTLYVVPLSYALFGVMWAVSCLFKVPLTAHYSMNDYNGEQALKNPIFMKTNRILTLMWGVLYILSSVWTFVLMGSDIASLTGAINSVVPLFMGAFTVWFQKWYPARVARG